MNYLANREQNLEMNKELEKIFHEFDLNGDGVLSREELIMGYSKILGSESRAIKQVDKILKKITNKEK